MGKFLTKLDVGLKENNDKIWIVQKPLIYYSFLLDTEIIVPPLFETDLASVPRIPFIYAMWGGKAHHEGVLHDYLFRIDSVPNVKFMMANRIFLEAMKSRNKPIYIRQPMFYGVCVGGYFSYHKKYVKDEL